MLTTIEIAPVPEQGQMVRVRNRFWFVQDVVEGEGHPSDEPSHRVLLECIDDDLLGHTLSVIWEHEVDAQTFAGQSFADPARWDTASMYDAFTAAVRWSSTTVLERAALQAPFYAAIDIEEYQLEPVVRALTIPRVNLLVADDVGLGKTIEAGLVVQELLARRRIRRILVICPASLQRQWQEEMRDKFRLDFQIVDRESIQRLRQEFGMHVNPWTSFPRLITSMDFIKREQPLRLFLQSLQGRDTGLRDWDLLIVDEAHNIAPSGRSNYAIDSDRTRMMRAIGDHFEHRLFLTATPHNGFSESFTALLELLDPLRFSRGPTVNKDQVRQIMIRRLKDDVRTVLDRQKFAERRVEAIPVDLTEAETALFDLLDTYAQSRLERLEWNQSLPVRFALTMLKKRLLSSPKAFERSLETHLQTLGAPQDFQPDEKLLERMTQRVSEDWADDAEKNIAEEDALVEASRFFTELTPEEQDHLREMSGMSTDLPDTKLDQLVDWIDAHLISGTEWNGERLVVFTEYKDTLEYLEDQLTQRYGEAHFLKLFGGMGGAEREVIKGAFQAHPDEHPVRILLATDAASEGLNLQNHCRYMIHYEIPWNPNRMEQRNGRIDRHGQKAPIVYIHHFLYEGRQDTRFLQTVIEKVQTMREDLGSVGDVIAAQVEEAMFGKRRDLSLPEQRRSLMQDVVRGELLTDNRVREIRRAMERTQDELSINPQTMALVLDQALRVHGMDGLQAATDPDLEGRAYRLRSLPDGWRSAAPTLKDRGGRWLDITFDHDVAHERQDVTLLHLNHPLMRYAVGTFRARIWSRDEQDGLRRVSYRVVGNLRVPVIVAYGRLVATGARSQRLHEEVVTLGAEIEGQQLYPLEAADVERMLHYDYDHPAIPVELGNDLRRLFPLHQRQLLNMLEAEQERQTERLGELARARAEEDANAIRELIEERRKELDQRIRNEAQKDRHISPYQLELFDRDEYLQYQEDMRWLEQKRDQMRQRLKTEPDQVREGYQLRDVRIFPLGLLYLLPHNLVKDGGR